MRRVGLGVSKAMNRGIAYRDSQGPSAQDRWMDGWVEGWMDGAEAHVIT